jgi:hypothetical protein
VPAEYTTLGSALKFEPQGLVFSKPATLKYRYPQGNMQEGGIEESLSSFYYINDDSTASKAPSTLNMTENLIEAQISHFSFGSVLTVSIALVNGGFITSPSLVDL